MSERIINAKIRKDMITFDQFWKVLYDHGASRYHQSECFDLWNTLDITQQAQLHAAICTKIRERRFVDYNPLRAMRDNIRQLTTQQPASQPTNYNGRRTPDEPCVIAIYNGAGGVYTLREAKAFNMTIKSHLS